MAPLVYLPDPATPPSARKAAAPVYFFGMLLFQVSR
jgi:hypothetical protein